MTVTSPDVPVAAALRRFSTLAAGVSALMGAVFLFGDTLNLAFLTVKPSVAACFLLASVALWLQRTGLRVYGMLAALPVLLIGLAALAEDAGLVSGPSLTRMEPSTAFAMALLGAALLLLKRETSGGGSPAQWLGFAAWMVGYLGLLVYTFRPLALLPFTNAGMAASTAVILLVLSAGVLAARPDRGWVGLVASDTTGGFLLRRFLPVAFIIPIPVSWVRILGQRLGWAGKEMGIGIPAATTALFFFGFLVWTAKSLNLLARQRESAEEEVEQSREWLAAVLESSRDGIAVEADERIVFANRALARLYGYEDTAAIIGRRLARFRDRADNERLQDYGRLRLEGRPAPATYEFSGVRRTGEQIFVEASVSVASIGGKRYIISVERDISARKDLEAKLRQTQKMEAVGQLAGGVAHDFNNLLGVIIGYVEILQMQKGLLPQSVDRLEQVERAARRAAGLTRQLLAFSRQQILEPTVLDVNKIVADSQKLLARLLPENIEFNFRAAPQTAKVRADRTQLEQVLMNLAVNARDAMPQGGSLSIETEIVKVDEAYAATKQAAVRAGNYVVVVVTDTGIGMDAATQTRIFEPFFTTKERDKGTGLGLATVYGIVKQSDGYIWVYSEVGRGTSFRVYLPQVDAPETEETKPGPETALGTGTILVVEDSASLRELFRTSLETSGYTVLEAANGPQGLEIAEQYPGPIHMLVTDVIMPVMGGSELAARFAKVRPEARLLYVSGYPDETIVRQGELEAGVTFLQKPFGPVELVRRVRAELDAKRELQDAGPRTD